MIESSKYNVENYPRKCFWTQERETRVKFKHGLSANEQLGPAGEMKNKGDAKFWGQIKCIMGDVHVA